MGPLNTVSEQGLSSAWSSALSPLLDQSRWIRAYAWFHGILGVLVTLSIVGILFSWALFWIAWVLNEAANAADQARQTQSPQDVARFLERFSFHLLIQLGFLVGMLVLVTVMVAIGVGMSLPATLNLPKV